MIHPYKAPHLFILFTLINLFGLINILEFMTIDKRVRYCLLVRFEFKDLTIRNKIAESSVIIKDTL